MVPCLHVPHISSSHCCFCQPRTCFHFVCDLSNWVLISPRPLPSSSLALGTYSGGSLLLWIAGFSTTLSAPPFHFSWSLYFTPPVSGVPALSLLLCLLSPKPLSLPHFHTSIWFWVLTYHHRLSAQSYHKDLLPQPQLHHPPSCTFCLLSLALHACPFL